ncbi:MAG: APC family permease [Pseudomonadota bacterium]
MIKRSHTIGLIGLTTSGITTMIGSGWMLAGWKMSRIAGPAAIIAWPIGALVIFLLALNYAELGSNYPERGGMARYTQMSHGSFAGFISAWAGWISIVATTSIEAVSTVQYASSWEWTWARDLYNKHTLMLTNTGFIFSVVLLIAYFLANYWSIRLLIRFNILLVIVKIVIPIVTCLALFHAAFSHYHTLDISRGNFTPYGVSGIFTAFATGGVIFSFLGFQTPVNLSGEARNPRRDIPLAILISIIVITLIYVVLQIAFVGALSPQDIINGWHALNMNSPYIHLALAFNLQWLVTTIYVGAFVSPSGAGMLFTTTGSRMLYAIEKNGYMPKVISKLDPVFNVPRVALFVTLLVAIAFLWLFRGWSSLVSIVSVAILITFANGPVSAMALRKQNHTVKNGFRIKGLSVIAPLAFIIVSLSLYWSRWPLTGQVILIILLGLVIYFYYEICRRCKRFKADGKSGIWLICYLLSIAFVSYVGSTEYGGKGYLNSSMSMIVIILLALFYFYWGIRSRIPQHTTVN